MKRVYGLVDCNNFYASCERVFNPSLRGRPVVILSNNDGCIVARSEEAKAIGIPFASPWFKVRSMAEKHNTAVFSSNYALYADLSLRVMNVLRSFTPDVEVYSIDEAFLLLAKTGDMTGPGREIKEKVYGWTGIPVSVGIGHTRTLAKAAAHIAKRDRAMNGVLDLTSREDAAEQIARIAVRDIWGIGPAYAAKLNSTGRCTWPVIGRWTWRWTSPRRRSAAPPSSTGPTFRRLPERQRATTSWAARSSPP